MSNCVEWKLLVDDVQRLALRCGSVVRRWKNHLVHGAWEVWCDKHVKRSQLKELSQRSMKRWVGGCLGAALVAWHSDCITSQRRALSSRKVFARWMSSLRLGMFRRWTQVSIELRNLRVAAMNVLTKWTHQLHVVAWGRWHDLVCRTRASKHVVARFLNKTLCSSFHAWVLSAYTESRMKAIGTKILQRWNCSTITNVFVFWHHRGVHLRRQARVLSKVAVRMWNVRAARVMLSWEEHLLQYGRMRRVAACVATKYV